MTIQPGLCRIGFHKSQSQKDVTGCQFFPDKESENLCFTVHFPRPIWKAKTRCAEMFCTETFLAFRLQTSENALIEYEWQSPGYLDKTPLCDKNSKLQLGFQQRGYAHHHWNDATSAVLHLGGNLPRSEEVALLSNWQYFALVKLLFQTFQLQIWIKTALR